MTCPNEFTCAMFADGELPESEAREVAEHIESCNACRALVEALTGESRLLVQCFQDIESAAAEVVPDLSTARLPVGAGWFCASVLALATGLRFCLSLAFGLEMPAWLAWLDPRNLSVNLGVAINAVPYAIENGGPLMVNTIQTASLAALAAIALVGAVRLMSRHTAAGAILGATVLFMAFSSPSYAIDLRKSTPSAPTVVPAGTTVNDTVVAYGEGRNGADITIDGTVKGDLIVVGNSVIINGTVEGNVIACARRVEVNGTVGGGVFAAGQTIRVTGQMMHNLYGLAQTLTLDRSARVDGNAFTITGDTDLEGYVGRDAAAIGGSLNVRGEVARNVFFRGGQVSIVGPAHIGGGLEAHVGRNENVQVDAGATIDGSRKIVIDPDRPAPNKYATVGFYVWQLVRLAAAFVTGMVLFWLAPALRRGGLTTGRDWLEAGALGFGALVILPAAAIVVGITVIGLPLALSGLVLWLAGLYFAKIMVAQYLGRSLMDGGRALPLLGGLVIVLVAVNLPFVGGVVNFLLTLLGLGALVVTVYKMQRAPSDRLIA